MTATPRLATTILLLHPDPGGFRVFLVQRHRKSGFMPSAWVFPGGRVDPADHLCDHPAVRGGARVCAQLGGDRSDAVALAVAGVRETFEEAGIWLGDGALPEDSRGPLCRGEVTLASLLDAHGATIALDRLRAWSWWVTPRQEKRRYDTRFLVARVGDVAGRHDDHETVDSGWFTPAEVLEGADRGAFALAPPTWWTLRELAEHDSVDAVLAASESRPHRPIEPILAQTDSGLEVRLPGHPEHPEPAIPGMPPSVRYAQGRWWV